MSSKPVLKIYKDRDADLKYLQRIPIAIVGYGSQGRAQALNLRDRGLQVMVGLSNKSKSVKIAKKEGFEVYPTAQAVKLGQIISVLAPDHLHKKIYDDDLRSSLSAGKILLFACGFSIYFKLIVPPKDVDVAMVAPHAPGEVMRTFFLENKGVPCFIAVEQDYSGKGRKRTLA
jgi:ketol-acid reductoisomerase